MKTQTKQQFSYWYVLLFIMTIGIMSIGIAEKWALADYPIAEVRRQGVEVYPPIENPIVKYVLLEVYKASLDPIKAITVIDCESKWNLDAVSVNKNGSIDRGLWQINNKFHPEVSNLCSFSLECSTQAAIKIIKKSGWGQWVCSK